ncbi:protein retinal degeneration B [Hyalella azteca]|uniref:Protein retinal degeneration B n=1 Tax=Hyalella azteca TaxID=294128 RepID=A0A8B7PK71_HYAAZ|nr:protein retinal degeneration B [Hyalella azteca]
MLIKEYRIPLPLTVEEYRIAQLYMIAKKSRMESHSEESGVQILVNEPYTDGPGPSGAGQYTRKVYYVASHLPGWLKALIPKSALTVEEEAWNAYPYTKTRYTCSMVDKFSLEVETVYHDDGGHQDNVFNLTPAERKLCECDLIDVVRDQTHGADYNEAEDPTLYRSSKTGRGPLQEDWIQTYWAACQGRATPLEDGRAIMCAYKLCKVEFRYWGMQSKIEKFIHDVALRKTMLKAHQQAWAWQDEWWGLTIADVRAIEEETMALLQQKYASSEHDDDEEDDVVANTNDRDNNSSKPAVEVDRNADGVTNYDRSSDTDRRNNIVNGGNVHHAVGAPRMRMESEQSDRSGVSVRVEESGDLRVGGSSPYSVPEWAGSCDSLQPDHLSGRRLSWTRSASKNTLSSQSQVSWRMESIRRDSCSDSGGDDEFFDCPEHTGGSALHLNKWSSLELLTSEPPTPEHDASPTAHSTAHLQHAHSTELTSHPLYDTHGATSHPHPPSSAGVSVSSSPLPHCPSAILVLVLHAGSVLETPSECSSAGSDLATFRHVFEGVVRQQYPVLAGGGLAFRLVPAETFTASALHTLTTLSGNFSGDGWVPVGALPVVAEGTAAYAEAVASTAASLQAAYRDFLSSSDGIGFTGHVCIVGDCVAGLLLYDVLCQDTSAADDPAWGEGSHPGGGGAPLTRQLSDQSGLLNSPRRRGGGGTRLEYETCDVFLLGCPLALVLLKRKMICTTHYVPARPRCQQLYNLFHPTDPLALRLEPLLAPRLAALPPVIIPRYTKHPLGDSQPTHLLEYIQRQGGLLSDPPSSSGAPLRRSSDASLTSTVSGLADTQALATGTALREVWWGSKRLDYALYCPDGLANFPPNSLPHLFHASFWESSDVAAFILRQVVRSSHIGAPGDRDLPALAPTHPREKWIRKRTSVKLKNVTSNHRGNDVLVRCGAPQTINARFMYGPLDMVALSGEKVDMHIMRSPPNGEWCHVGSPITDKTGRLSHTLTHEHELPAGIYPVKMTVRGDHTGCTLWLAVVPVGTHVVVFSIDGALTASVSVSGADPKVRPGAVDVLRVWQQRGYLLLYITGRPDLQHHKVLSWLAKHNFPHGLLSFVDGITTDPLGHKASYLRSLVQDHGAIIDAAYGSTKDIGVYSGLGLAPEQIYVVGKANKKQHTQAQVLAEGYSGHLSELSETLRAVTVPPQLALTRTFCSPVALHSASVKGHRIWASSSVSGSPSARRGDSVH